MADELIELTASIVASYVENNRITAADLPTLIQSTFSALSSAGAPVEEVADVPVKATPAQIRRSIAPDAITSFEDGKSYKSMKRHLALRGLTPAAYREKWGLPADYPMVSPAYSAARSAMAKRAGLGARGRAAPPAPVPVAAAAAPKAVKAKKAVEADKAGPSASVPKAKAGRPKKAIKPEDETFT